MLHKPNGQVIGYIRVSTQDQNPERQLADLNKFEIHKIYIDYASGKDLERPELQLALGYLREGDTLIVSSMDRLARNLGDLRNLIQNLSESGIQIHFLKENLIFTGNDSPMAHLLLSVMGAFAEFERSLIKERQKEGIAIAKKKGKYKGRKSSLDSSKLLELLELDKSHSRNRSQLARDFGISRQTVYNYLAKFD